MAFTGGDYNGANVTTLLATPPSNVVSGKVADARIHAFFDSFDMATATVKKSKSLWLGYMPKGVVPLFGLLGTTATLGTATISVGITGSTAKYRADAVLTATSWELLGVAAGFGTEITAQEEVLITNSATADLPTSGIVKLLMLWGSES